MFSDNGPPSSSSVWRLCFRGADVAGLHASALFVLSLIFFAVIITLAVKLLKIAANALV